VTCLYQITKNTNNFLLIEIPNKLLEGVNEKIRSPLNVQFQNSLNWILVNTRLRRNCTGCLKSNYEPLSLTRYRYTDYKYQQMHINNIVVLFTNTHKFWHFSATHSAFTTTYLFSMYHQNTITRYTKPLYIYPHTTSLYHLIYIHILSLLQDVRLPRSMFIFALFKTSEQEYFKILHFIILFQARSQNCEKRLLASSYPSVRMEQLGSHWTDFDETWYLRRFS
jgi:hypothetical protein